jgi:hypothetical protein
MGPSDVAEDLLESISDVDPGGGPSIATSEFAERLDAVRATVTNTSGRIDGRAPRDVARATWRGDA